MSTLNLFPGPVARAGRGLLLSLIVATASLAWVGVALRHDGELHSAPVAVVGPNVVTVPLAERVYDDLGNVLRFTTVESADEGRRLLDLGQVVAVIELDLTGTRDRVLLAEPAPARDQEVLAVIRVLETQWGREVRVERSGVLRSPAGPSLPSVALLAVAAGYVAAVMISVLRGPVAPSFAAGARRFVVLSLVAGGTTSLALAAGYGVGGSVSLGAAGLGAGLLALGCEVIGGLRALLGAAFLLLVLGLPLVVTGDRWLLGQPWRSVTDWTLVGAATAASEAPSAAAVDGGVWVVLGGTIVIALGVLLGWRVAERRASADGPTRRRRREAVARRRLLVLAIGVVGLTGVSYGLGGSTGSGAGRAGDRPSLASTTRCVRTGGITTVRDLNRLAQLRGSPAMRGGDVGASGALQDGRRLWMFGDTIRNDDLEGGGFVRNSMLLVAPGCLAVVLPDAGGAVIPDRDDRVGYWPMSVLVASHPGYDLVAVTAQRVRTVDAGDVFGFENLGPAVATYVVPVGGTPQLVSRVDIGDDLVDTTRPMWGAASVVHDGYAYLYGTARPEQVTLGSGFSLAVARVPVDEIADGSRWEFWDGRTWTPDPGDAAVLVPSRDGVSQTLSVFTVDGRWYALSKRNDVLGRDVVVWTAPGPTGPFEAHEPVAEIASDAATGTLRYMPLAHPGLLPVRGTVIVSYSQNRTDSSEVFADPRLYRPRFLRVRLPAG